MAEPTASLPVISVVICTRNRAEGVRETLNSLLGADQANTVAYEIVVVDNGSKDQTRAVIESFQQRYGAQRVVYAFEPIAGLARARNTGIAAARGETICFTDDDCLASPDWINQVARAMTKDQPLAGVFGRVLPLDGVVGEGVVSVKTSETPRRYQYPCSPFVGHGNNMAFNREALLAVGGFDPLLGVGAPLRSAEELDMAYRLLRKGYALAYEPACILKHRPRVSATDAQATEWRNAIGIGAFFSKHLVRGDLHAAKCLFWFLQGLCGPQQQKHQPLWLFFLGVPCGMLKGVGYNLYQWLLPVRRSQENACA